jgi:hypothetical protein
MEIGEKEYVASRKHDTDKLSDENEKEQFSERRVKATPIFLRPN